MQIFLCLHKHNRIIIFFFLLTYFILFYHKKSVQLSIGYYSFFSCDLTQEKTLQFNAPI